MRIALINDFPQATGIGNYAFSLFGELKKISDVEMVLLDSENNMAEQQEKTLRLQGNGFPFLRRELNNAFVFPKRIPDGFDAYIAGNQYLSHIVSGKEKGIVSCMDIISKRLSADYNPIAAFFWNSSLQKMNCAKKIIAASEYTRRDIIKHLHVPGEKIEVVYLGFDREKFMPLNKKRARQGLGISETASVLLNVGSEEKRKNIPTLLKAFAKVLEEKPDSILVRVGAKSAESARIARQLKIDGKVVYLERLPQERLSLAYNAADALVFCSYFEGFGLPVLEAMACGTPVVAAKASSVPEIVCDAGILVKDAFSAEEFSDSISRVLDDLSLRKMLERKGFARSKNFSWKKNAEETKRIIEETE